MKLIFTFIGFFMGVVGGGALALLNQKYGSTAAGTWPVLLIAVGFFITIAGLFYRKD